METRTKYKVGDRVKVRKDLISGKIYHMNHDKSICDSVVDEMTKFAGKYATIEKITYLGKYRIKDSGHYWTDEMFEDPEQTIVIYRKDRKVIAYNKATGEKAEAKCCPEDTFDFNTGAKLAFERLLNADHSQVFKLGDIIVGCKSASWHYRVTCENFIGYVVKAPDGYREVPGKVWVRALNRHGTVPYLVESKHFRLATDDDIALAMLKKHLQK